jgi:hypothetical protein
MCSGSRLSTQAYSERRETNIDRAFRTLAERRVVDFGVELHSLIYEGLTIQRHTKKEQ